MTASNRSKSLLSATNENKPHKRSQIVLLSAVILLSLGNLVLPASAQNLLIVDYLVIAIALCLVGILANLHVIALRFGRVVPFLLFLTFASAGFMGSISEYGTLKAQALVIALVLAISGLAFRSDAWLAKHLVLVCLTLATLLSVATLLFGGLSASGRLAIFDLSPISIARVTGIAVVLSVGSLLGTERISKRKGIGLTSLAILGTVATIATGSRGPLVAAIVAIAAMIVFLAWKRRMSLRTVASLVAATGLALMATIASDSTGLERVESAADSGRVLLYSDSLDVALDHPLGIGWGNLASHVLSFMPAANGALYSHNVFLEIWVEAGVLALLAFVLLVLFALKNAFRASSRGVDFLMLAGLLVYALANAQFSSDIIGNRMMWLFLGIGLAVGAASSPRKTPSTNSRGIRRPRRTGSPSILK